MIKSSNRFKKNKKILLLLVLILSITVGFALLSTTLNINGTAGIKSNTWDIHFGTITPNPDSVDAVVEPHIVDGKITYEITLTKPGDFYEFNVDVVNGGSIDAKLSSMPELSGVSSEQDAYINYTFTHADESPIVVGEELAKSNGTKTFKVRVEFDPNADEGDLPSENQTLHLTVDINYQQK